MQKLYAFRGERFPDGWFIYIHKDALAIMKGKLDNVGLYFSDDRNHIMIFPLNMISKGANWNKYSSWLRSQRIQLKQLCVVRKGKVTSVCESCTNYLTCVGSNFAKCTGMPEIDTSGSTTIDLAPLTFVGSGYASEDGTGCGYSPLNRLDLTEEGMTRRRKIFCDRARHAATVRKYRKDVCSQCIITCRNVRSHPDRAIGEGLINSVYDILIRILFNGNIADQLRWSRCIEFDDFSHKEKQLALQLFQVPQNWSRLEIQPYYTDKFKVIHGGYDAIIDAKDVKRIFEASDHTIEHIRKYQAQFLYIHKVFNHTQYYYYRSPYINENQSMCNIVSQNRNFVSSSILNIPGTDLSVLGDDVALTDNEILKNAEDLANEMLKIRKARQTFATRNTAPMGCHVSDHDTKDWAQIDVSEALKNIV